MEVSLGFIGTSAGGSLLTARRSAFCKSRGSQVRVAQRISRSALRMMAQESEENSTESESATPFSAQEVLSNMRQTVAEDDSPRVINTGVTRDLDGKSNVWAVEPNVEVDDKPEVNSLAILGAVVAVIAAALLILPRLPLANPDQF